MDFYEIYLDCDKTLFHFFQRTVSELFFFGRLLFDECPMSLKVVGAGFGRTGTLSLKSALEQLLGGPCYHMLEVFENPENRDHPQVWLEAHRGRRVDWHALLNRYSATVDWPGCTFYEELMHAYPDAMFVLTTRSFDSWYRSASTTIYETARVPLLWLTPPHLRRVILMIQEIVWRSTFKDRFLDKELAKKVFEEHNARVVATIPAGRLLVFEVRDGWEPLCKFLGLPVPSTPFPYVNDFAQFQRRIAAVHFRGHIRNLLGYFILALSLLIVIACLFWTFFWS